MVSEINFYFALFLLYLLSLPGLCGGSFFFCLPIGERPATCWLFLSSLAFLFLFGKGGGGGRASSSGAPQCPRLCRKEREWEKR